MAVAVTVPLAVVLGFKVLPNTPIGRRLSLTGLSFEATAATDARDLELVDREGVVEAVLRPAGMARIDGRRVDVVSRGEMIEAGARVRVLEVRGNRVVVVRIKNTAPHTEHIRQGEPMRSLLALAALPVALAEEGPWTLIKTALGVVLAIGFLVFLVLLLRYANLWIRSVLTGAGVGLFDMFGMSLRRVNPSAIVNAMVMLVQSRITKVDKRDLEAHLLAGGAR